MSALKRKEAREVVVGLLFETEFKTEENSSEIFAISTENREIPEDEYIKAAYFGVCENRDKIDALVAALLEKNHLTGAQIEAVLSREDAPARITAQ